MPRKRRRLATLPFRVPVASPTRVPIHKQERLSARQRGYDTQWDKARAAWFRDPDHVLCVHCLAQGRTTAATELDHIVPHRGDKALFWDRSNWQSLCRPHHEAKSAREGSGWRGQRDTR